MFSPTTPLCEGLCLAAALIVIGSSGCGGTESETASVPEPTAPSYAHPGEAGPTIPPNIAREVATPVRIDLPDADARYWNSRWLDDRGLERGICVFVEPPDDQPEQSFCYVNEQIRMGRAFQSLPLESGNEILIATPRGARRASLNLSGESVVIPVRDGFAFVSTPKKMKDQSVTFTRR